MEHFTAHIIKDWDLSHIKCISGNYQISLKISSVFSCVFKMVILVKFVIISQNVFSFFFLSLFVDS